MRKPTIQVDSLVNRKTYKSNLDLNSTYIRTHLKGEARIFEVKAGLEGGQSWGFKWKRDNRRD